MAGADYLSLAIQISEDSLSKGGFPAGAVIVTKNGQIYKSGKSVKYFHGEFQVIKNALDNEESLEGAKMYCSMEPCLMCTCSMYWSGCKDVDYVIPKSRVKAEYAYENSEDMIPQYSNFFVKLKMCNDVRLLESAIKLYEEWVRKIEA